MKGDFSRIRFTPTEHFTSVLQQQGRVSLDADVNEQRAIDEYLRTTEIIETIGPAGGPTGNAGFQISVEGSTIHISGGRYYVHGLLCEGSETDYMDQPFLISPSVTDAEYLQDLEAGNIDAICVQLQVWQRLVTALDDPCLLEPALGQADTTARLQTVWRVVASPILPADSSESGISTRLTAKNAQKVFLPTPSPGSTFGTRKRVGRLCVHLSNTGDDCSCQPIPPAGYQGLENQLYRIEIHQPGDVTTATFKWSRENASVVAAVTSYSGKNPQTIFVDSLGKDANLGFAPNQWVEISDDGDEFGDSPNQPGQLCQISSVSPAGQPPSITFTATAPAADPTRNARVRRWDQPGTGTAGDMPLSVNTPIDIENGIQVTFTVGLYNSGDYWLIPARTASGTLDWPPCGSDGRPCQPAAYIPVYTTPLALITARPVFKRAESVHEPHAASGTENNSQRAAQEGATGLSAYRSGFLVRDLRSCFTPLASSALHIDAISWLNDDVITLDELASSGLQLQLDNTPTSIIDSSVFRVTVEIPNYGNGQRKLGITELGNEAVPLAEGPQQLNRLTNIPQITQAPRLRTEFTIDGFVTVLNDIVYWQLLPQDTNNKIVILLGELLFRELNALLQAIVYAPDPTWFARVRVRLLGHMIFSQIASDSSCGPARTIFLDGQCFAIPGTRQDQTPRMDLEYPSGNGAKASDFESWFYLAPATAISSVTFDPASVTLPARSETGTATGTVKLGTPVSTDTTITLASTPATGVTLDLPASLVVPAGQNTQSFTANITVTAPIAGSGVVCTVTASVPWKARGGSSVSGSFTVLGTKA